MSESIELNTIYYERPFRIRHYECDAYGHVNHANYLRYMQEAAFDASAAVGYDFEHYRAMGRLWLVRETDDCLQLWDCGPALSD